MAEAGLSLGSNLGNSRDHLAEAVRQLAETDLIRVQAISDVFRTPPWGVTDQPDFLNICALVETSLVPLDLLHTCQSIETALGRERLMRWGPRTLDIDILWYGELECQTPDLVLPHPRMLQRGFVMVPLATLVPERVLEGITIGDRAALFSDEEIHREGPLLEPEELPSL
ncbi:MAG: 2-amino-4-hydroxy-6-hydroxymethyldihydropteridine diphosphokinase [Pseudomonadota bacterium]